MPTPNTNTKTSAPASPSKQAAPTTKPTPSRLALAKPQVLKGPRKYFFYGAEGTGKTTLAADAVDPIFFDLDEGSSDLVVARYPFHLDENGDVAPGGYVPRTYDDVRAGVKELTTSPHSFRTLVIDTGDKLEALMWAWMIERDNDPSVMRRENPLHQIEDYGYGKGYERAVDVWREFLLSLDRLRVTRQMTVVILAHAKVAPFKNPEGPDFDRWVPAVHPKAAGVLKAWSDVTGRVCHEETTRQDAKKRVRGIATGSRVIKLAHSAAFDAKARGGMPDEVEIPIEHPWSAITDAESTANKKLGDIVALIEAECERVGDQELTAKVDAATKDALAKQDDRSLLAYLNNLKNRPSKEVE